MPRLISGSVLRRGGSGEFIDLEGAQPQLPVSPSTGTGFTLVTDNLLRTSYNSSLGFIEFNTASMYSSLPQGTIRILATGTAFLSTGTQSGTLVITGGVGIGANMHVRDDIVVNSLEIGQGYSNALDDAWNNIVFRGIARPSVNEFSNGQNNIAIGYTALTGLQTAFSSVAIGRYALSTGTGIRNSIAIGDYALSQNGVTYQRFINPITAVTLRNNRPITNITNSTTAVVSVANHGLSTGSRITIVGVSGISTGTSSLVNGQSFYVRPLTTGTFELYNSIPLTTSTALDTSLGKATTYSSSGTLIYPVEITVPNNDYTTGTNVRLSNLVNGLTELDGQYYWVNPLGSNVFQLYSNNILSLGVDGTGVTPWISGGTSTRVLLSANNIAIGTNAGKSLFDGERNFFLGDYIAQNLTTGSYNFFIGHEVGNNLKKGSNNISIMGDNLIDGRNDQINIGGIFYYDGQGNLNLQTDINMGLGTQTTATSNGALVVNGGVGISKDLRVGGTIYGNIVGSFAASSATSIIGGSTGSILYQSSPSVTNFLPIGTSTFVLASNGTIPVWTSLSSLGSLSTSTVNAERVNANTGTFQYITVTGTTGTGATIIGDLSVNRNLISGPTINNNVVPALQSNNFILTSFTSNTISSLAVQNLDFFSTSTYRTARYTAQIVSGNNIHVSEMSVFHNGSTTFLTEYGINTNGMILGSFDAIVSGGNVVLTFAPSTSTSMVVKLVRLGITI